MPIWRSGKLRKKHFHKTTDTTSLKKLNVTRIEKCKSANSVKISNLFSLLEAKFIFSKMRDS